MDNAALSGLAGGVSGFADSFLAGMKEKRDREAAESKFAAYMELQREMMGNKTVTGQELFDYGVTMGIAPEQLKPLDLGKKYNITLGKAWVDNLNSQKVTDTKEKGAKERAKIAAGAKKDAAAKSEINKSWKPEDAAQQTLENALFKKGYKKGTPLSAIAKAQDLQDVLSSWQDEFGSSIKAAGRENDIEPSAPFKILDQGNFWTKPKIEVLPGYKLKAQADAAAAAPAAGAAAPIGAAVAPTAAPTKEAVGTDRELLKKSFRKK